MTIMTDDFENSILLAYQGGTAPDLVGQSIDVKNFADIGAIVNLRPFIEKDEEYQKVNEPFSHMFEGLNAIADEIYWVASGIRSGVRIEYNKALLAASGFEGIPATLPEYIEMAKKITADGAATAACSTMTTPTASSTSPATSPSWKLAASWKKWLTPISRALTTCAPSSPPALSPCGATLLILNSS